MIIRLPDKFNSDGLICECHTVRDVLVRQSVCIREMSVKGHLTDINTSMLLLYQFSNEFMDPFNQYRLILANDSCVYEMCTCLTLQTLQAAYMSLLYIIVSACHI